MSTTSPRARQADAQARQTVTETSPDRQLRLLGEMAATIREAARALHGAMEGRTAIAEAWQRVRDLEHKGDAIARDVFDSLAASSGGVVDRQALTALTGYLDDVLDGIEAAAARLAIYRIRRIQPTAHEMSAIVVESADELVAAIDQARRTEDVFPHTRALHRLENRGDDVLRAAIETLFAGPAAVKDIVKWKDICEMLETCTDRCEDVANVLETLVFGSGGEDRLTAGGLVVDSGRHEVQVAGEVVPVSAKEFGLLHLLVRHQGKVVRRERLLREVWGDDYFGDARTLDTHVGWLRKKLESRGGVRIVAVRGIGYRLDLAG
jgi:DNA-binding response OmpR family regulator